MLHTIISYLSRFSRLALLTFALVMVLILLLLTVNSATNNNDQTNNDSAIGLPAAEDEVTVENGLTYDESSSNDSLVIINSGSAANSTDPSTGNPQSFTANSIDLDSGDTITVITTDETTQAALEAELENGHVSSTSTTLPSTGISSAAATALGLMALSAVFVSYGRSRKDLTYELKTNR